MTTVLTCLIVVAGSYAFFVVFAWLSADAFIFRQGASSYVDGPDVQRIPTADGRPLSTLHFVAPDSRFTVLYFHGNAEDLGDIRPHLEAMRDHGYSVLAYDYRGYGTTPGDSSEQTMFADAVAALHHLQEQCGVPPGRVIVYGRSLGSGPAVELAVSAPVAGLILQAGFISAFRVVTRVPLLPGDRFRNLAKLPRVRCPLLVMHGTQDRTIPFHHGPRLFAAAPEPKRHWWVEGAGHNNLVASAPDRYWEKLDDFVQSLAG